MPRRKNRKVGENREVRKNQNQTARRSGAEEGHVTEGIFCLLSKQGQKRDKKLEVQLFLACLLVPLALAGLSRFRLVLKASAIGLTVGLAIGGAESIGGEIAVGFFK